MFSTIKLKLLLALYIFIIVSIPIAAYLASQTQSTKSRAWENKKSIPKTPPKVATTSAKQSLIDSSLNPANKTPAPEPSTPTIATNFGPTLSVKATLEGRPNNNQSTKLFVGIIEGSVSFSPKYLLSFNVDLPASGEYSGLSLAGLTQGQSYSALLKGQAQLALAVPFNMSPSETKLNSGSAVTLISGDLNDDNTINSADLGIIKNAMGSNQSSANWNENADFNKDSVINIIDYSILYKNFGKVGDSGIWVSPPPSATPSAQLTDSPAIGSPRFAGEAGSPQSPGGHWIWIPSI